MAGMCARDLCMVLMICGLGFVSPGSSSSALTAPSLPLIAATLPPAASSASCRPVWHEHQPAAHLTSREMPDWGRAEKRQGWTHVCAPITEPLLLLLVQLEGCQEVTLTLVPGARTHTTTSVSGRLYEKSRARALQPPMQVPPEPAGGPITIPAVSHHISNC